MGLAEAGRAGEVKGPGCASSKISEAVVQVQKPVLISFGLVIERIGKSDPVSSNTQGDLAGGHGFFM
ncbi:MAG: hypothetical protein IPN20_13650 [Haliscomenobacter sp.]|nr:hypothetical protein [Haliscomenobacter sp.]MBK8654916.1 hypothetical protein [Haliscomenobacter sp.]